MSRRDDDDDIRRMQALMRMHMMGGGGIDFAGRAAGRERLSGLISSITDTDDEGTIMTGLNELCSTLSMGGEEQVPNSKIEPLVTTLLNLLHLEHNVELMLLACRALTYLMDVSQHATRVVVQNNGIMALCEKLLNVEFIDLAEQALMAMEKIAADQPRRVLQEGGVTAMLSFIEFFSMSVQRKVVQAVATLCKHISPTSFDAVASNLQQLVGFLQYEDNRIVENALLAIQRCIQGVVDNEAMFQAATAEPIITSVLALVRRQATLPPATLTIALKILHTSVHNSLQASEVLLNANITDFIGEALGVGDMRREFTLSPCMTALDSRVGFDSREPSMPMIEPLPNASLDITPPLGPSPVGRSPMSQPISGRKELTTDQTMELIGMLCDLLPMLPPESIIAQCKNQPSSGSQQQPNFEGEEEEEDEEDMRSSALSGARQGLSRVLSSGLLPVENQGRFSTLRPRVHTCDQCGRGRLAKNDWFHCNQCPDFDMCLHCFLSSGREHSQQQGGPAHTFTDMSTVDTGDSPQVSEATKRHIALSEMRVAFYAGNPLHLQRIVLGFAEVLRTYHQAVHVTLRQLCLECMARIVARAERDVLRAALESVPFSSFCASMLRSREPNLLAYVMYMIVTAFDALPEIFTMFYQREGVIHELREFMASPGANDHTDQMLRSAVEGFLSSNFGCESHSKESSRMHEIMAALKGSRITQAMEGLCDLMDTPQGISTHEIGQCGFLQLFERYLSDPAVEGGMKFVEIIRALGRRAKSQPEVTYLNKFVVLLQGVLNYYENLPTFLHEEHSQLTTGTTALGAKLLAQPLRLNIVFDRERSKAQSQYSPERMQELSSGIGERINVMIEPLATIAAIEEFIVKKLILRQSSGVGLGSKDDEDSESNETKEIPSETGVGKREKDKEAKQKEKEKERKKSKTDKAAMESKKRDSASPPKDETPTIYIRMGSNTLPGAMTIFQAVQHLGEWKQKVPSGPQEVVTSHRMWEDSHTIYFSLAPYDAATTPLLASARNKLLVMPLPIVADGVTTAGMLSTNAIMQGHLSILSRPGPGKDLHPLVCSVMCILRSLHTGHKNWASIVETLRRRSLVGLCDVDIVTACQGMDVGLFVDDCYVNVKLTNKLLKLLGDPLLLCSGILANSWCYHLLLDCPFLFPLTARRAFFDMACLGPTRALLKLQERLADEGDTNQLKLGRIQKQKVRLSRDNILESAKKLFDNYGNTKCFVEVEYYDEVGTGLGPTLEFYTLVSRAVRRRDLNLWVTEEQADSEDIYVRSGGGLFPSPSLPSNANVQMFKFVGSLIARALFDRRLLDIPMSLPLLRVLRDEPLSFEDVSFLNPEMYKILLKVLTKELDCSLLCRNFTLPGYDHITLCEGGENMEVSPENFNDYVQLFVTSFLHNSVGMQLNALRESINNLVPLECLKLFYPEELDEVLCGSQDVPSAEVIEASIHCDHGYSKSSRAIRMLLNIVSSMTPSEWSSFVKFVTGASRLPAGGLRSLRPPLTIVRKTPNPDGTHGLPSVMTCQNYLKLPDYESEEKMSKSLKFAINEGGDTFHLS